MKRKALKVGLECKLGKQDVVIKELGDDEVTVTMDIGGNQQTVKIKRKDIIQTVETNSNTNPFVAPATGDYMDFPTFMENSCCVKFIILRL